jgi:hypothetical protein
MEVPDLNRIDISPDRTADETLSGDEEANTGIRNQLATDIANLRITRSKKAMEAIKESVERQMIAGEKNSIEEGALRAAVTAPASPVSAA